MSRVAHPAGPRHGDVLPADHPPTPPKDLNALHPAIWPRGARRIGGVLTLGGIDVRDLAAEFGTPALIMDEADVRSRAREYVDAFGEDAKVSYASKAFCSRAVLRWVTEEGLGVDVCTGGELAVALSAGVDPALITLHGNNKLPAEIEQAVAAGVGHIVVDSFEEIARLAYRAEVLGKRPRVLVRVTTGVEAHTHEFMATAHDDQKFGFSLTSGAADEAVRRVLALPQLEFAGLHSHIGSQIFDTGGFELAARRVLELAGRIHAEHGVHVAELDLGGGFGIAYVPEDDAPEVKTLAAGLRAIVASECIAVGHPGAPADDRAWPGHHRAVYRDPLRGRHDQGRGRAQDLRERGRRDERQRPHRPVRRFLYLRARIAVLGRRRRCCRGWWAATARAATSWCGTATCRRTSHRATCSPSRRPERTAGRSPRTTTTCRALAWWRWPMGRRGRSSAGRHWMTCCDWMSDDRIRR